MRGGKTSGSTGHSWGQTGRGQVAPRGSRAPCYPKQPTQPPPPWLLARRRARSDLTDKAVQAAAEEAGITVRRWQTRWWRGWMIDVGAGQGAMNTRMAEAATKALNDAGWDAGTYYMVD